MSERFFAPCPRGLERPLAEELLRIGAVEPTPADGGVGFAGAFELVYGANLESRIASRVLWEVGGGGYDDEDDLYALASTVAWEALFAAVKRIRVNVAATGSLLTSLEFATLRIKDAVCDRFRARTGARPSVDKARPDVRIHAHLTRNRCTLYLDTSGEPLFKRGYRKAGAAAPLRENLAAGLLALAGWRPDQPLLDPMCGSGTIAIEAAMVTLAVPPGLGRRFGFQQLLRYDGPAWQRTRDRVANRRTPDAPCVVFASDIDPSAVAAAESNARAAGVGHAIRLRVADVLSVPAPAASGVLVSNPPYGVRLDDQRRLARFYPLLGDALKARFAGWTAHLLSADTRLPELIGLRASRRTPLFNGALECRLYEFRMVAGTLWRQRQSTAADGNRRGESAGE